MVAYYAIYVSTMNCIMLSNYVCIMYVFTVKNIQVYNLNGCIFLWYLFLFHMRSYIYIYTSYMLAVYTRQSLHTGKLFSDFEGMRSSILIQSNFGFSVAFIIENCNYISILVY